MTDALRNRGVARQGKGERMDRLMRLFAVLFMMMLLQSTAHADPNIIQLPGIELYPIRDMVPNGEYEVFVQNDAVWEKAGSLSYDRFFRERELGLDKYIQRSKTEDTIRIRLVQKDGAAAHIDSVFLGGVAPVSVSGVENGLKKLSRRDYDVADAFGKTIEITFPKRYPPETLALTARVEGNAICETPFQFPPENLYKSVNENSLFYVYRPNARKTGTPFFKQLTFTGSGHPPGFTYGWVKNDRKNLYVKIDFTPDNTMDGDKDYAKVHVKSKAMLKEFKVSARKTRWGKPDFTYTDKVAYQHKVYDFTIPLKELGITGADSCEEIQLAFSAYGTACIAGTTYNPAIAHDPKRNRYLVVYEKNDCVSIDIYGRFVDYDGKPLGNELSIAVAANNQSNPAVSYDSINQKFLVVWGDTRNDPSGDIYGQIVNGDGTLSGGNFAISDASNYQDYPAAAFDTVNNRFLIVWYDNRNAATWADIYGQFVNSAGQLIPRDGMSGGDNFVISDAADNQNAPSVAYDGEDKRFLVVWHDWRYWNISPYGTDVYGQLVNAADGALLNTASSVNFLITANSTGDQQNPSVAYNTAKKQYLVVWEDGVGTSDISGQLVSSAGQLVKRDGTTGSDNFVISNAAGVQERPSVEYDSVNNYFLAAWNDYRNGPTEIYGQKINEAGTLNGTYFGISGPGYTSALAIAFNSSCANFMVVFSNSSASIQASIVGTPCGTNNPPSAPLLVSPADGQTGLGTTVTCRWKKCTDPEGDAVTYHLYYCADQSFAGCNPIEVASSAPKSIYYAGMGGYAVLLVLGVICAGCVRNRKGLVLLLIGVIIVTGILFGSCSGGGGGGAPAPTDEKAYTVAGLTTGTTYYWKVAADDGKGGVTESAVRRFSTQ